ncbi:MAG: molybdopterin-dependent oxidoreductase, partial [Ilumatobacter sp.]|nr:molybdopterin-dependent oxidoreductase [Ilumatobacter sp.]
VMWGSNARNAHPIFFHHVLTAIERGAKLYCVDPRRSDTAQFADRWLGLHVGTDVALSNTIAREIIHAGLVQADFVERATTGYDEYAASVEEWTLERGEQVTGVPAEAIRELAHAYAGAKAAQLCWTLGITEHHNGVDNVLSLCNLALLTGQVGRYGAGLTPLRGQNNVQGGGDMGALPNKLPGFQDVVDDGARAKFEAEWGVSIPPQNGWHLTQMFEAMERDELRSVFVIGENPAQSEADVSRAIDLLSSRDHLVVLDIHLTKTAELADVVLPGSASWCESEGTVTNSERRVQRVRKALDPPGDARDDIDILLDLAARLGQDWQYDDHEQIWDELRRLSPMHAGMAWSRLEQLGGIQWPCFSEDTLEPPYLHGRLWADEPADRGRPAPFSVVIDDPPVESLTEEFPLRLTTGRRLDSYNTGVQSGGFSSPNRFGETVDVSPEDAERLSIADGEMVRISSPRGTVDAPARIDPGLRPGLVFMTFHFPDEVDVNQLTIDATDPASGTAEFKAAAVRIDKFVSPVGVSG